MREGLIFASVILLASAGFANTYTHNIVSPQNSCFESVPNASLIRGYNYYYYGETLEKLEQIPQDTTTSNVYVQNINTGYYELKFESSVSGTVVNGYYAYTSCATPVCEWEPITSNVITNSGLEVYYKTSYFTLEKYVENCGDGFCETEIDENCGNCVQDCACEPDHYCSNNACVFNQSYYCGDEFCNNSLEENCETCFQDCPCIGGCCVQGECVQDVICGDGECVTECENCGNCDEDCGCGYDYYCEENTCVFDAAKYCGDGVCNRTISETCFSCSKDCSCTVDDLQEETYCGNGNCDFLETCQNCEEDCGECMRAVIYNAYNHTCTSFSTYETTDLFVKANFKKMNDTYKRYFMTSLDCPYSINKYLYTKTCATTSCVRGLYCSMGFGEQGAYTHKFRNVKPGLHTLCVWSSAPNKYNWGVELEVKQIPAEKCGDRFCNSTLNESCENCIQDCGLCTPKAYKVVEFKFNKTNTWREGEYVSQNIIVPLETTIINATMNLKASNNDPYFARSVHSLVNGQKIVIIPWLKPRETIYEAKHLDPLLFKQGFNEIKTYITTSNEYSINSWIEGSLRVLYEGLKPYASSGELSAEQESEEQTVRLELFKNEAGFQKNYSVAKIFLPENTTIKKTVVTGNFANNNNTYAQKTVLVVNSRKVDFANWVGPGEVVMMEKDCTGMFKTGLNHLSVIFEGYEKTNHNSKVSASITISFVGSEPVKQSIINVDLTGPESQASEEDLIETESVVLKNEYGLEDLPRKASLITSELKKILNKTEEIKVKALALSKYYEAQENKREAWRVIAERTGVVASEVGEAVLLTEELAEKGITENDLVKLKQRLILLDDHYSIIIDDVFEVITK
jgi:hypothetical protein